MERERTIKPAKGEQLVADDMSRILGAVVIGRNEGERLVACLESLKGRGTIAYVDSGSTDGSVATAVALGVEVVELDMRSPFTAARARNAGFRRLRSLLPDLVYVQFVDGDCEVVPGWTDAARAFLDENVAVAAVCGRRMERHPERSIYNAMCDREWDTPVGEASACGGDSLMRAGAFDAIGGFKDDQIAHEEPEMCDRLIEAGWKVWRLGVPMTFHDAAIYRLGQFYKRNRRAGVGISQYLMRDGPSRDQGARGMMRRALIWAVILPAGIVVASFALTPMAALAFVAFPAQIARHSLNDQQGVGGSMRSRVQASSAAMIGKFAEAHGVIDYFMKKLTKRKIEMISYK